VLTKQGDLLSQQEKLLSEQGKLFSHQQEVAESLKEQLIPAHDPSPIFIGSGCGPLYPDDFVVFVGASAYISHHFPYTVLRVGIRDLIQIVKPPANEYSVLIKGARSQDNRIIARLGGDNSAVNPNNML